MQEWRKPSNYGSLRTPELPSWNGIWNTREEEDCGATLSLRCQPFGGAFACAYRVEKRLGVIAIANDHGN